MAAILHPLLRTLLRQNWVFDISKITILFIGTYKPISQV
jgi:hypothetical protein